MNLEKLRNCIKTGSYEWRKHTLRRLAERKISQNSVLKVILEGEIIKNYPKDSPFPSCLMFGEIQGKPFHVVVSLDENDDIAYIITVYEPSLDMFKPDYKTRR